MPQKLQWKSQRHRRPRRLCQRTPRGPCLQAQQASHSLCLCLAIAQQSPPDFIGWDTLSVLEPGLELKAFACGDAALFIGWVTLFILDLGPLLTLSSSSSALTLLSTISESLLEQVDTVVFSSSLMIEKDCLESKVDISMLHFLRVL